MIRAPFPWFGAKQALAERIVALMPEHRVYVEPFGGGASVLLTKPRANLDVYNDVDGALVRFFRVLRDQPEELAAALELTPYSREEWERCRDSIEEPGAGDVELARRWFVMLGQAYAGDPSSSGWGGERLGVSAVSNPIAFARRVDRLRDFARRLRGVQIERRDWRDVLERYDGAETCFYIDPPYMHATRRNGRYRHELADLDHAELVARVAELQGSALVSGYDHSFYLALETAGYVRHEWRVQATAGAAIGVDRERVEVLWRRAPNDSWRLFP